MGLAAFGRAGVTGVKMRFIPDLEVLRRKALGNFLSNSVGN